MEMNSFDENLGLRIKLALEKAGLTQEQLAERINKSSQLHVNAGTGSERCKSEYIKGHMFLSECLCRFSYSWNRTSK